MSSPATIVGRRIAVVGTSGSGKTYVAEALAAKLGYTYISNDAIIWRPNWQETPHTERVQQIEAATRAESWTYDGNLYARNPDDRGVMQRCDTIVWLDLPRWQVWSQVIRRTLRRIWTQEELWNGNRESLRILFLRNSVIWWSVKSFARRRRRYGEMFADAAFAEKRLVRLRSRREVDLWLGSVEASARSGALPDI